MVLPAPSVTSPLESDPLASPAQGPRCLNCGTPLIDAFCAHCGQRAGDVHLSVRDLLHELAAEHFGLDTKVARTLIALMRYPGRLTQEFLAGRRIRYLPPLRLYLSLSLIYFLASALATNAGLKNDGSIVRVNTPKSALKPNGAISHGTTAARSRTTSASSDSGDINPQFATDVFGDSLHGNAMSRFISRRAAERSAYFNAHKKEAIQQVSERFREELPDALFLLVPGLALALLVLYHSGKRYYSEHLVFALHLQAFVFAALTIGLIPYLGVIANIAMIAYLFLALRRVYGEGIAKTAAKFFVIVMGYLISLAVIMGTVGIAAFLFA